MTLARRALGVSRIGHTGTLDPMATGVLPLVIGRATRLAQFLTASDKSYEATVAFGRTTDTLDASGTIVTTCDRRPTRDELAQAIGRFRGRFDQTPPVFSAKNIDGERSYDLARRGKLRSEARPKAVSVNVKRLEILSFDGNSARLEMQVTAGFYVRSLAHDLGAALECGAVLAALRRTQSGEFGLDRAVPLAEVLQSPRESLAERLIPFRGLLSELPSVTLRSATQLERLKNGVEMAPSDLIVPFPFPQSPPEAETTANASPEAETTANASPEAETTANAPPEAAPRIIVRLLGPDGDLVGLAKPSKNLGNLHGWVVLG